MFHSTIPLSVEADIRAVEQTATSASPLTGGHNCKRIALIGGFAPRQCGIATFTTDTYHSLKSVFGALEVDVYPMAPPGADLTFEPPVRMPIVENDAASFARAAAAINQSNPDAVWLQHEFGLFGGDAGDAVLPMLDAIAAPLIVTFHTVLAEPDENQMRVMKCIIARASKIIVMSTTALKLMRDVYNAAPGQLALVPHGTPDRPFGRSEKFKAQLGMSGQRVLMTFGLLSPGKGIESVITALPDVIARQPDAVYYVVGATHPNLRAREGEAYRERLKALAQELGVNAAIRWIDAFLSQEELLDYLEAADIYLTPYLGANQATSGTLAYAVALGKAVISTPYVHARELLEDDHGVIVPFGDADALSAAMVHLLGDPGALLALQERAYQRGRSTVWSKVATDTMALVDAVVDANRPLVTPFALAPAPAFEGIRRLTDDTGMYQHSVLSIPDRSHGYCVDDNARALMLMSQIAAPFSREADRLAMVYAAFVQHAWNPDRQSFRNFMSFSREWLEDLGSCDSNGRTLWALSATARHGRSAALRSWARQLFDEALPSLPLTTSPRTSAFAGLAADNILAIDSDDETARALAAEVATYLVERIAATRRDDWPWFETRLTYDNCRLPEALIRIGLRLGKAEFVDAGLATLTWVCAKQTAPSGHFRPIGSEGFLLDMTTLPFDQQPVEAWATIDAADAAFDATGDACWIEIAQTAYQWFDGANDRGVALADHGLGTCRDGISPRGENRNEGAESTLALHFSHVGMQRLGAKVLPATSDTGFLNRQAR